MTNIPISQSFEDLKTYQSQYNNNYTTYVNENNKLVQTIPTKSIFQGMGSLSTDWAEMNTVVNSNFGGQFGGFENIVLLNPESLYSGIQTLYANYQIELDGVSESIIPGIQADILVQPEGTSISFQNQASTGVILGGVNKPVFFQILQTNEDSTINLLVIASMSITVQVGHESLINNVFYYYPTGLPLPASSSKLILTVSNPRTYT